MQLRSHRLWLTLWTTSYKKTAETKSQFIRRSQGTGTLITKVGSTGRVSELEDRYSRPDA